MHLNGQKPTYYLTNAFTLGNFALEFFFTLILLALVLGDWTARSAALPARLVVQLILVHFLIFFHAMYVGRRPCEDLTFLKCGQHGTSSSGVRYQRGPDIGHLR